MRQPIKKVFCLDHSIALSRGQTLAGCSQGETPDQGYRRLKAPADKKGGVSPYRSPRRRRGRMARPAAHWAQEPDKGNADVGREQHGEPKERQRDHKATTARQNAATKQIKRR